MITTEDEPRGAAAAPTAAIAAVRRVVILAAGKGHRLQPLTAAQPKCLVEVNGQPLLPRALRALAAHGVTEAVIVIGHQGDLVRARVGARFAGVDVRYVEAPHYATTNNIRSLWDAREYLDEDILLVEADLIFDDGVIAALLEHPGSSAAVAPLQPALSGTVVRRDPRGCVASVVLGADQGVNFDPAGAFKTLNIYLLRKELLRDQLLPRLRRQIEAGRTQDYYESIFRDFVADGSVADLAAVDVSRSRWYEIDDHRDLEAAQFLFLDRDAQFDRIQQLYGSYWRYGFVDHSYLYNLHFPPPQMLEGFREDLREVITNYPVGQAELARLVADWTGVSADQLVVANGAAELIKILGNEFLGTLAIPTPSFNEYEQVIAPHQLNRMPLDSANFDLDVDAFAAFAIEREADTAVIVSPNNPTARSVSPADLLRAARRLEPHGCRLIVDESFVEFSRAGREGSVESMVETHPNLVVLKSMSKVFGVAGLRIGYLLSSDRELVQALRARMPIWNVNGMAEAFLRSVGRYRREFVKSCDQTGATCRELYDRLLALPGLEPIEPDANFILCKLGVAAPSGPLLARRLYVEHNMLIKDCAAKSMPEADRYVRIASRTAAENERLTRALATLL